MTSHAGSRAAPVRVRDLLVTHAPAATILIRLLVGSVFLTEGVQKFLYPAALGAGRFANIGIPAPEATGPFVGAVEAVGGVLLLLGCLTRLAALVLTINIAVALVSTKLPVLLGHQYGVDLVLAGHEHFFEHWVERYRDAGGQARVLDQIVSGGGGAPPYPYRGEPDLREYVARGAADSVRIEHLVRPAPNAWENPHHDLVVHVDGDRVRVEVIGVDAGADFQPYRSRTATLEASPRP